MRKHIALVLLFLAFAFLGQTDAYTVVLKSGKVLTGTLISESADAIVFRDSAGIQYSLKKSSLDLSKMEEANAPKMMESKPSEAPMQEKPVEKKKARVYTREDLDALRSKYGELTLGREKIVNSEDFENGMLRPEAYVRYIREGAARIPTIMGNLQIMRDSLAVAWEDAARTNKDPKEVITTYLAGPSATDLNKSILAAMGDLEILNDTLSSYPPEYDQGYQYWNAALTAMVNYHRAISSPDTTQDVGTFRAQLDQLATEINSNVSRLQTWQPPPPAESAKPKAQPAEEPPSEDEAAAEEQPETE